MDTGLAAGDRLLNRTFKAGSHKGKADYTNTFTHPILCTDHSKPIQQPHHTLCCVSGKKKCLNLGCA